MSSQALGGSMRAMRALTLAFAVVFLVLLVGQGCSSSCSTNDDCGSGEVCLFPVGSGCGAKGHCGTQDSCVAKATPIVVCSCTTGENLGLPCAPTSGIP